MIVEINNIPFGKVEASTPEHEVLSTFARNYMMKHGLHKKRGILPKILGWNKVVLFGGATGALWVGCRRGRSVVSGSCEGCR